MSPVSVNFNVLRYSLLGAGVVYGAIHRYNLESASDKEAAALEWRKEEKLIAQAKKQWAKQNAPKETAKSGSINWEDPNLDIGKALESVIAKLD